MASDLIDLDYLHWNWLNRDIWFTEMGLDPARARPVLRTTSYVTQLDVARAGLGVALGWRHLVDSDLAKGTLVRPVPATLHTGYGCCLLVRQNAEESVQRLAHHLMSAEPRRLTISEPHA